MTEQCDVKRCGNAATGSIEDPTVSFSFCDVHFGEVTSAALREKLSLADAVQAVARAGTIEDDARLEFRLHCGRTVHVEGCHISLSTLGFYAGSGDAIRAEVIERLYERAFEQFPSSGSVFVKPVPDGHFPAYMFTVALVCHQPVIDPHSDLSTLTVCWLGDDIETSLPAMIEREIRDIDWGQCAVDGHF
jgi:hypothetical protein